MKILIIGFAKFRYMPYLTFYLNAINKEKNDVDIIYWDRDGKEDSAVPNYTNNYKFNYKMRDDISKVKKNSGFSQVPPFCKSSYKQRKLRFYYCAAHSSRCAYIGYSDK